jgi:hypothetical protein
VRVWGYSEEGGRSLTGPCCHCETVAPRLNITDLKVVTKSVGKIPDDVYYTWCNLCLDCARNFLTQLAAAVAAAEGPNGLIRAGLALLDQADKDAG